MRDHSQNGNGTVNRLERPVKFEFVINLDTAKRIGVMVPQSVLFRADTVIK